MLANTRIKLWLAGNAGFSTVCACVLLLVPDRLAGWLGIMLPALFGVVGGCLLLFALALLGLARQTRPQSRWVHWISLADFAWVAVTLLLLSSPWREFFVQSGLWLLSAVALFVLFCGIAQLMAVARRDALEATAQGV